MSDDADILLIRYGLGKITFQELSDKFGALASPPKKPVPKNWAQVYQQAEEGDDSLPAVLSRARYAGNINAAEEAKLRAVYRKSSRSAL
jgi:hypothetical protein